MQGSAVGRLVVLGFTALAWARGPVFAQGVTNFEIGSVSPHSLISGSDGAIWFDAYDSIGRLSFDGAVKLFPVPAVFAVAWGPDGNLWFTDDVRNSIGRMTQLGVVTEFSIPTPGSTPQAITAGPDGALWFVEFGVQKIGRVTTSGSIKEFDLPPNVGVSSIVAGFDGAVWFAGSNIGRITTTGVVTVFPATGAFKIVRGPDGALWYCGSQIGRITTSGVVTEFGRLGGNSISAGSDGALWFTIPYAIGRLTPAGVFSKHPLPSGYSTSFYTDFATIVEGSDGAMWFSEFGPHGFRLGRMDIDVFAAGGCPPSPDRRNIGLATFSTDFEAVAAGTPIGSITIPDITFHGAAVTASVEDTNIFPLQTIHGKSLVWTLQRYQAPGWPYPGSGVLDVEFPADVVKLTARYAIRAKNGQHAAGFFWFNTPAVGGSILDPEIATEQGAPPGAPFFKEGVLEFPDALTPHGQTLRKFEIQFAGSAIPADFEVVTMVLDDIEAEVAPPCRFEAPNIMTWPEGTLKTVVPGVTVPLSWTQSAGTSASADYVLEVSRDCEFSTLESSMTVSDTQFDLLIPSTAGEQLLYVRVYAEDSCSPVGIIRSPGSARALQVAIPKRDGVLLASRPSNPRFVPPR